MVSRCLADDRCQLLLHLQSHYTIRITINYKAAAESDIVAG